MNKKKDKVMRDFLIIGNWKMHKTVGEAKDFIQTLGPQLNSQIQVGIAAPFTAIFALTNLVKAHKWPILIGAQNMHEQSEGAYTGEISALMLKEVGSEFVLIGHSERRHIFHESCERIHLKVRKSQQEKLNIILCIGELLQEREEGKTEAVLKHQIYSALHGIENLNYISLAYEPVWAIGTGKVANPEEVQEIHAFCRSEIAKLFGEEAASKVLIQYGGSVQRENAALLAEKEDIDGLLIGGASLNADSFAEIIQKCSHTDEFA